MDNSASSTANVYETEDINDTEIDKTVLKKNIRGRISYVNESINYLLGVIKFLREQLKTKKYFFKIFLSSNHEIRNFLAMLFSIRINKAFQIKSPP